MGALEEGLWGRLVAQTGSPPKGTRVGGEMDRERHTGSKDGY